MKRADLAIALCLLALAGGLFLVRGSGISEIHVNGKAARESMQVNDVAIEIENSRARVTSSPCKDQLCLRTGWLERPGEVAVCLPQRVIVELRGARGNYDSVAY